jgi:signal recognition particle subunit SRP54
MDQFDLNQFRKQLGQMQKVGSMRDLISKIPGMAQMGMENLAGVDADEEMKRIQGIIDSMTPAERCSPGRIDLSRRRRIAAGSGVDLSDVSGLLTQFDAMATLIKRMSQMSMMDRLYALWRWRRP